MVKNINSAFGRGLQDTRDMGRRPLLSESPEPKITVEAPEQKAVSEAIPEDHETKTNEASGRAGRRKPVYSFDRRLGTNLTDENYLALRIKSVETNMTLPPRWNNASSTEDLTWSWPENTRRPADTKRDSAASESLFSFPDFHRFHAETPDSLTLDSTFRFSRRRSGTKSIR